MNTTAERIKKGLQLRELKQADLVERTGISKGALSSYMNGRYIPKQNNIYLIAKALNVSESWLMGFDVPMERTDNFSSSSTKEVEQPKIMDYYAQLNFTGQQEATKRVKELTHLPEYTLKTVNEKSDYLAPAAAHNDAGQTEKELDLMREDAERLKNL